MKLRGRTLLPGLCLAVFASLVFLGSPARCADKPKTAPAPAKPAAKPATPAAKPAGGGASTSKGPTTSSSHGPTTSSPKPATTTTAHPSTTTAHPTTTTVHSPTSGTAGHSTTAGTAKAPTSSTGKTFGKTATPAPKGSTTVPTKNGGSVTKRANGQVATVHDPKRGMDVHRNLSGGRTVVVERGDHTRIVAVRGGHGYVQHPVMFHGHEYARRSYYYGGRYYHAYYGRYYYHGLYVNPYYPAYYWRPAFYGWAYNPWAAPITFGWGWGVNPWYGYYGAFFTPYPVYAGPAFWLTDYIIANSLAAAYQAQAAALANPAPLSPEVKNLIADEVKQQIALENSEAQAASAPNAEPNVASSSIQRMLDDGKPHVFVAGQDLDVVDAGGTECALSEGDAIQLSGQPAPDAQAATLAVLASKGGKECPKGDTVSVQLTDLQEMQNHMRQTIDDGMQELQKKQGTGGLPAAPASAKAAGTESPMAAIAPPPPPEDEVKGEINQESKEADKAEQEANGGVAAAAGPNDSAPAAEPANVELGFTVAQVEAAWGQPVHKATVGTKTIYSYKDTKVVFVNGKVTDVQ
jgi:hypothetical protein